MPDVVGVELHLNFSYKCNTVSTKIPPSAKTKLENLKTQNVPFKTFHQIKQQQRRATLPIDSNSHEPKRIVMEFDLVPWAVTNVAFAISS